MDTLKTILAQHPFFEGLPQPHLELLTGCATNVVFKPGEYILREGGPADHFYIIRQGRVAIETNIPNRGAVVVESLEKGDILGWSWLFPPYRWHFDGRALELTRALALDGACLRGKIEADHNLGFDFFRRFSQVMMDRLQATRLQMLDIYKAEQS